MSNTQTDRHPKYDTWEADERRMRATYHATRRQLVPYLVPHRFEGREDKDPTDLRRSHYGYAPRLNGQYLSELMGHVRGTAARYVWGELESLDDEARQRREDAGETTITDAPGGGTARLLWDDCTLTGTPWPRFFEGEVLEWGLSSPGGFVLCDVPNIPGRMTELEERREGRRPYAAFIPMSRVKDVGVGGFGFGFRWVEFMEDEDSRPPPGGDEVDTKGPTSLLYFLDADGNTNVIRRDEEGTVVSLTDQDGDEVEVLNLGAIYDAQGFPVLPLVPAFFGTHPDVPFIGAGLLLGLDDIVIDIFNRLSETVEGYRDGAFTNHTYRGDDYDTVKESMSNGSRLVDLGSGTDAALERMEGGLAEVTGGMELVGLALQAWTMGAKSRAAEAMEAAEARSGVSLKAEFQLDSRPLLVEIAQWLDMVETNCMWVLAQLAGVESQAAAELGVARDTTFQMEDEAQRISRIVGDFATALPLPAALIEAAILRWAEASDIIDLNGEIETIDGQTETVRDRLRREAATVAEARQRMSTERGDLFGFGGGSAADLLDAEDDEGGNVDGAA